MILPSWFQWYVIDPREVEERMDFITTGMNWTNFRTLLKHTLVEAHHILSMQLNSWN